MSKLLLLYSYKKYYNRIISKLTTFEAYQALITPVGNNPAQYQGFTRENVNFDYEDGISAQLVINIANSDPYYAKMDQPDYCVLEESKKVGDNIVKKLSRYYVLEAIRTRGNQYELTLRRDLLADFYDEIIVAPTFIQRGNLNAVDPLIFNREGFTYNQIKKHELLLNFNKLSNHGQGWIVGYLNRGESSNPQAINDIEGIIDNPESVIDYADLPEQIKDMLSDTYMYTNNENEYDFSVDNLVVLNDSYTEGVSYRTKAQFIRASNIWNIIETNVLQLNGPTNHGAGRFYKNYDASEISSFFNTKWRANSTEMSQVFASLKNVYDNTYGNQAHRYSKSFIDSWNGKLYRAGNATYRIHFDYEEDNIIGLEFQKSQLTGDSASPIARDIHWLLNASVDSNLKYIYPNTYESSTSKVARCSFKEVKYHVYSTLVGFATVQANIPATRNVLLDAPYDMFCIPIGSTDIYEGNTYIFSTWNNVSLPIARGIALKGTTAIVSDIQILPYCPFPEMLDSGGNIDRYGWTEDKDYTYITDPNTNAAVGIILFPRTSKGTFDLEIPSEDEYYTTYDLETISAVEKKVKAETQFARFCSPNFASFYDINIQKNNGISRINVDYFYKPYAPYIHVAPYFSGLYGEDFNDPKGLICGGEFSMATAASKWEEYQIQNKNYELIFNRQIENLDVNNSIAMEQLKITSGLGIASGTLQGIGAGGMAGGMVAGPYGAAVGAVVGGISGGITGAIGRKYDIDFLTRQQKEARDYSIDMYTYQLGNIKALPNSLTRVSAFTENNKIFPFIEFYDCTEEEKQALRDKILYNGMTVMKIGQIKDYIQGDYCFVQGQLVRLININEDNHVIAEIANELKEGAYFYGYDSE